MCSALAVLPEVEMQRRGERLPTVLFGGFSIDLQPELAERLPYTVLSKGAASVLGRAGIAPHCPHGTTRETYFPNAAAGRTSICASNVVPLVLASSIPAHDRACARAEQPHR